MRILFFAIISLISCNKSSNTEQIVSKKDVFFEINLKAGQFIHYYYIDIVAEEVSFVLKANSDTTIFKHITTDQQIEIKFNQKNESVSYLFFPGDSIKISSLGLNSPRFITNDSIRQNEIDYQTNEWTFVNQAFYISPKESYDSNLKYITKQKSQLESYLLDLKKANKISEKFYNTMISVFASRFITASVYPVYREDIKVSKTQVDFEFVRDNLVVDDDMLRIFTYRNALWNYLKYLALINNEKPTLIGLGIIAEKNFKGKSKDFLLARIAFESLSDGRDNSDQIKQLLEKVNDPFYKNYISENIKLKRLDINKLMNSSDLVLDINEFNKSKKDSLIYIDFWASWCVPCKEEMNYYPQLLKYFKGKKIQFVFISLDKDIASWKKIENEYSFMRNNNSFILGANFDSDFAKKLNIKTIPRYVIVKNGEVIVNDALRPSDNDIHEYLRKLL